MNRPNPRTALDSAIAMICNVAVNWRGVREPDRYAGAGLVVISSGEK
jgi:hypothetical protein